jgi:hypothetical protein
MQGVKNRLVRLLMGHGAHESQHGTDAGIDANATVSRREDSGNASITAGRA